MVELEIIRGLHNIRPRHKNCVITLGTFDGVHKGHQQLLDNLSEQGSKLGLPSLLITFEPTPREYFRGEEVPARLTRFREKITLLRNTDLDRVLCIPFNEGSRTIPAEVIIEHFLVAQLGVRHLTVGDDFRFGRDAEGDFELLQRSGKKFGFSIHRESTYTIDSERVSSTRIRQALQDGDFDLAKRMLGRPYFMIGPVVKGKRMGTQLGVPTANIRLQRYRSALEGVYAVTVQGLGKEHEGSAYVGRRPTLAGIEPLLEVYLFDFDEDIYGSLLTVVFHKKFREDVKFGSVDDLKQQMQIDLANVSTWFETNRHKLHGQNQVV